MAVEDIWVVKHVYLSRYGRLSEVKGGGLGMYSANGKILKASQFSRVKISLDQSGCEIHQIES